MKLFNLLKQSAFFVLSLGILNSLSAQESNSRWEIKSNGEITWEIVDKIPHQDHIEMSGKRISGVVRYGVNEDHSFSIKREVVWPLLRTIPNHTHASLTHTYTDDFIKSIIVNGRSVKEKVTKITLNGTIVVKSMIGENIELERTIFPSTELPAYCELYEIKNNSAKVINIEIPEVRNSFRTNETKGIYGVYTLIYQSLNKGVFEVEPDKSLDFSVVIKGEKKGENYNNIDVAKELKNRHNLINEFWDNLILKTPDKVLNRSFAFAKIRGAESIYQTKGGPMHGPGGLAYYAAIWANDQAEYINPFFPYLGYGYGIESAINSYNHFSRFMNDEYNPIPSSIIAEGVDIWNGAGDRGDGAMIAYGAARFAMSLGDRNTAEKLWPLIEWCLEYNHKKLSKNGVVASDTDELEGRFPAGNANLCTSSLYYDALLSAAYLGKSLGKSDKQINDYQRKAKKLKTNIDKYFGANVMGYETYRYYDGNEVLRSWICIPLTMGIYDRKEGTINALFSPELWTNDGLATVSGDKTFWDRATLYGLRGVFAAGDTKRGLYFLKRYSKRRLLGEHVPYPIEAYPEGGQRHLSAESGLYCRIYLEGILGIRPTGLKSFNLTPNLPEEWDKMSLERIHGYGEVFDIKLKREDKGINIQVIKEGETYFNKNIPNGNAIEVKF